ncbi:(E)-beta-ocimene synthase, chloroplastic [Tanacetum coccineum]
MLRLHTRWYIDTYIKQKDTNGLILNLATLDFNMVKSLLKQELHEVVERYRPSKKLGFIRDQLMECYFWAVGMAFEPQYGSCRVGLTKIGTLIATIDDIYDVYGSQDELKIFTDAVKRFVMYSLLSNHCRPTRFCLDRHM